VPRRKPATIDLDDNDSEEDDEEDMDVDEPSQSNRHRQATISNTNNGSDSTSELDNSDGTGIDTSDGNDDLTNLNSASLQERMTSEVQSFQFLFVCIYLLSFISHTAPTVEKPPSRG
jgi:hypothetical protein